MLRDVRSDRVERQPSVILVKHDFENMAEVQVERRDLPAGPTVTRPFDSHPASRRTLVAPHIRDRASEHSPRRVEERSIGTDPDDRRSDDRRGHGRLDYDDWHLRLAGRATATKTSHSLIVGATNDGVTRRNGPPPQARVRPADDAGARSGPHVHPRRRVLRWSSLRRGATR